jgi:hypothetical protein
MPRPAPFDPVERIVVEPSFDKTKCCVLEAMRNYSFWGFAVGAVIFS